METWKEMTLQEKIKKISKYATNFIGMIMFIIAGLNQVEGIDIPIQIYEVLGVIQGAIGAYLVGGKLFNTDENNENEFEIEEEE